MDIELSMPQKMQQRNSMLSKLIRTKQSDVRKAPEGKLRISHCKNISQFFHRMTPYDRSGIYIPVAKIDLAKALAQKDYDERVIKAASREIQAIDKYLALFPEVPVEEVYGKMTAARRNLVMPVNESDEDYTRRWLDQPYPYGPNRHEHAVVHGENGEAMDSKSELLIAGHFDKRAVAFLPQFPVQLKGYGLVYADFKVLNTRTRQEYIWEHLGMLDKVNYRQRNLPKLNAYIKNGFIPGKNLILSWESEEVKFDMRVIDRLIDEYLM